MKSQPIQLSKTEFRKIDLDDFARWFLSDTSSNLMRASFAEYLVNLAIGNELSKRLEWNEIDIEYRKSKIEVKSGGYITGPFVTAATIPRFDIKAKTWLWDARKGIWKDTTSVPTRPADIYVFCVVTEKDKHIYDISNISQWSFGIVRTDILTHEFGNQKSVSLTKLKQLVDFVQFDQLKNVIDDSIS